MNDKKIIVILLITITITTSVAIYSLVSKGKASPSIAIVFDQKRKAKKLNFSTLDKNEFWNNYPYLVLTNTNRVLEFPPELMNENGIVMNFKTIIGNKPKFFLRIPSQKYNEDYVQKIFDYLNQTNSSVALLFDRKSPNFLKMLLTNYKIKQEVYMLLDDLNELSLESESVPYFLVINENLQISKIYFPRIENTHVTKKYITYIENQISN